jgi:hypothetical protein
MSRQATKEEWIALFQKIGLDEAAMSRWHKAFEQLYPEAHQGFLEWLQLPAQEITEIRARSKGKK